MLAHFVVVQPSMRLKMMDMCKYATVIIMPLQKITEKQRCQCYVALQSHAGITKIFQTAYLQNFTLFTIY
jgi:hypothetical protein